MFDTNDGDGLWENIRDNLPELRPFKKLAVEARVFHPGEEPVLGDLPGKYRPRVKAFKGVYVVYSKGNPVAWRGLKPNAEWLVPYDVRYNVVSIEHQRLIRHALKP